MSTSRFYYLLDNKHTLTYTINMMDTPQVGDIWKNNWSSNLNPHNCGETHYLLVKKVEPDNSKDTKWVAFSYKRCKELIIFVDNYSNEIVTNSFSKVS